MSPRLRRLALRDAALAAGAIGFWTLTAELSAGRGVVADFFGLLAGLAVGVVAYLLHEWGHLAGALAVGSVVHPSRSLRSPFVFSFDSKRNSRQQFLVMSLGGFGVTAAAIGVAYGLLPDGLLATRVARGAIGFLAFLGVAIELPLFVYTLLGGGVPPVDVGAPDERPAPTA